VTFSTPTPDYINDPVLLSSISLPKGFTFDALKREWNFGEHAE
jgi:hypothetical protein